MSDVKKNEKEMVAGCLLSWPVIILAGFLFWPVGLALLALRLYKYKNEGITYGRTLKVIGLVFALICLIGVAALFDVDLFGSLFFLILSAGGVALFFYGRHKEKEGMLYKRYLQLVINERMTSIPLIAFNMRVSEETAIDHLEKMIDTGYLADSRVDRQNMIVVVSAVQKQIEMEEEYEMGQQLQTKAPAQPPRTVKCDSCGANNLITGKIAGCEFCGSQLS